MKTFAISILLMMGFVAQAQFSISPEIEASVVVGVAPMPVIFDATATTASDTTIRAFHELHYQWNFGDFFGGRWTNFPKSKNRAANAITAHIYDSTNWHIAELEVARDASYSVSRTMTLKILDANDFYNNERTICFSTSGNFTDVPHNAQKVIINDLSDVEPYLCDSVRWLFRRGDTIPAFKSVELAGVSHLVIGAYGPRLNVDNYDMATNAPIIKIHTDSPIFSIHNNNVDSADFPQHLKIMELRLVNATTNHTSPAIDANNAHQHLLYRLRINNFAPAVRYAANNQGVMIASCKMMNENIDNDLIQIKGKHIAIVGNYFHQNRKAGHVFSSSALSRSLISNNEFTHPGRGSNCFYMNATDSSFASSRIVITENHFTTRNNAQEILVIESTPNALMPKDVIIDRNYFLTDDDPRTRYAMHIYATDLTIRNNIINGTTGSRYRFTGIRVGVADSIPFSNISITNNTIFKQDRINLMIGVELDYNIRDAFVVNNLVYSPSAMDLQIVKSGVVGITRARNIYPYVHPFIAEEPTQALDFQLASSSLLLDKGISKAITCRDYFGQERCASNRVDVGAFQFTETPVVELGDIAVASQWTDYPTMAHNYFTLDLSQLTSTYAIEIFDVVGDLVFFEYDLRDMFYTWQTQGYENGIYWIKVSSKNATMLHKVLIQR